jgi:hypothetical protein
LTISSQWDYSYRQTLTKLKPESNNEDNTMKHTGDFEARNHTLEYFQSLTSIGGHADFQGSAITDLGQLTSIGRDVNFQGSAITDLGQLTSIGGHAYFQGSAITDLGQLTSIGRYAYFQGSAITDLIMLGKSHTLTVIDGMPMVNVKWKRKNKSGIEVGRGQYLRGDLRKLPSCFLARVNGHTAHGETLRQAIEDAQFKSLEATDTSEIASEIKKTNKVTLPQWRAITRACSAGTAAHLGLTVATLPESMALTDALELSKNSSYGQTFKRLIESV